MPIPAMGAEDDGTVAGFMCATDWECEVGCNTHGNHVWPSLEGAVRDLKCAEGCGVVEVRIKYHALALRGKDETAATDDETIGD